LLRRNPDSAGIYTPRHVSVWKGNGWFIEGICIAMSNDNMTNVFRNKKVARKPPWRLKKYRRN
jgi:hypothetical protein